jgi:NAD(P)-dependent dehydrogenase (short-subunit alcohol dehydrogenase family)
MSRTIVVTGAASGIGAATAALLRDRGDTVIGVDLGGSDVDADLSTAEGCAAMVDAVRDRTGGRIDAVVANAGSAAQEPWIVRVNYFGAVRTLERLRPLLAGSDAPRAAITSSMASFHPTDPAIVDACLSGDEGAAVAAAEQAAGRDEQGLIYSSSKRALNRWMRSVAATDDWAGASIPINAIAPGVVVTPMTQELVGSEEGRQQLQQAVPMPLHGYAQPEDMAEVLAFLVSPVNRVMTGQVIFVDGGADVVLRGDEAF